MAGYTSKMKILAAGGGSGGHVTPVLAVINELAKQNDGKDLSVRFICDRKFGALSRDLMSMSTVLVEVTAIWAGKLRRYHGVPWWQQLGDLPTLFRNLRDVFLIGMGFTQSAWLIARDRPDVVFLKGGFVCLPVGLAAALFKVPIVIHDSDAHPGLTNRLISKWATLIATGSPVEYYSYPKNITRYTGIPTDQSFKPVSRDEQLKLKADLGLPDITWPLVVVTGGGLGARRVNRAMVLIARQLLDQEVAIMHITGEKNLALVADKAPPHPCYIIKSFVSDGMAKVIGAADIVITRAGATSLLEIAAMQKPTIIVPNKILSGGHQLKNAAVYDEAGAAVVLDEADLQHNPGLLLKSIEELLPGSAKARRLSQAIATFVKPQAASEVAELITATAATLKNTGREGRGR